MSSSRAKSGTKTPRAFRFNAKTSLATRYPDVYCESDYLLRKTNGTFAQGLVSLETFATAKTKPQKPRPTAEKQAKEGPAKVGSVQKDPYWDVREYVNESESDSDMAESTTGTRSSKRRAEPSTSAQQLVRELESACEVSAPPRPLRDDSPAQGILYTSASSLQYTLEATSSSSERVSSPATSVESEPSIPDPFPESNESCSLASTYPPSRTLTTQPWTIGSFFGLRVPLVEATAIDEG